MIRIPKITTAGSCQQNKVRSFLSFVDAYVREGRLRKRWGPIEGEQEGENPAFRAGKGQVFPACEPREGQRESKGAKGYERPI